MLLANNIKRIFLWCYFCVAVAVICPGPSCHSHQTTRRPNILLMIADDMGYGDLASYGHSSQEPNAIDQLAHDGMRFTQFYAGDSLCTPSRTSLMTGRLPLRVGMIASSGARPRVLLPSSQRGLPHSEFTMPTMFKQAGYRTGMVGKWHLGINEMNQTDGKYLPGHWFDYVRSNLPFTNYFNCSHTREYDENQRRHCFLYNGSEIIQQPINYSNLTDMLLRDFLEFLREGDRGTPFFFYFSFPQLHTELFSNYTSFGLSSKRGLYGSDLAEMAWAVGRMQEELETLGLGDQTLSIFMSDHGPHKEICNQGGDAGPLKGGKATTWEGGYRIPVIAKWKTVIDPGTISHSILSSMDLLPSLAALLGVQIPPQIILDGRDHFRHFLSPSPTLTDRPIFYYCNIKLMALRYGRYKYHFYTVPMLLDNQTKLYCPGGVPLRDWYITNARCPDDPVEPLESPIVYDLLVDQGEKYPLKYSSLPEGVVRAMQGVLAKHRQTLTIGDPLLDVFSDDVIPCCNPPDCKC